VTFKHEAIEDFWARLQPNGSFPVKWEGRLSVDEGYNIQFELADRLSRAGNARAGWKVATVNKVLQEQLGVTEPFFGSVRQKTVYQSGYVLPASIYIKPHLETEICFRVTAGIETATTAEQVRGAVDYCYPAFELVEKRCPVYDLGVALADNAEHAAIVLGAPVKVTPGIAFGQEAATLVINNEEMGSGSGAAILGDPINSILWMNNKLRQFGRTLKPGEFVMTGSLIRQFPLKPGDIVAARFSTIGDVAIQVKE
jgi:2-keto-4-pentenoate hydratase